MGGEVEDLPDNKKPKINGIPKIYSAHPTFGTVKPSHQQANIEYPHKLIEKGLNQEFVNYFLKNPNPDFIHPKDWKNRTYLQTACMSNNEQIFNILLPITQNLTKAIYNSHKRKNISFIERLIEKGADIHETYFETSILSEAVEQHLRIIAANLTEEQMNANHQRMIDYYNKPHANKFSPVSKEMLLHPKERINKSRKYIEEIIGYGVVLDENKIKYVKYDNRNTPEALKAIDMEVKWIKQKL